MFHRNHQKNESDSVSNQNMLYKIRALFDINTEALTNKIDDNAKSMSNKIDENAK